MATKRTTVYGNQAGPGPSYFRTVIEIYGDDNGSNGYVIYVRYYIQAMSGSNFYGTNISNSWGATVSVSGAGNYAVSSLIKIGTLKYGNKYSVSASSQYTTASGVTYKSTASGSWTAPKPVYTVSYNVNGGSGVLGSQTKTYGVDLTLSNTMPTREGYTFLGWATSSTATSATYLAGGKYSDNASVTLYAVWSIIYLNITFDASTNGGTVTVGSTTYNKYTKQIAYNDVLGALPTPTKKNYKFVGWNTSSDGTGIMVSLDTKVMNAMTLYAIFEIAANCYIRNNGVYVPGMMYVKQNGTYKTGEANIRSDGTYKSSIVT